MLNKDLVKLRDGKPKALAHNINLENKRTGYFHILDK